MKMVIFSICALFVIAGNAQVQMKETIKACRNKYAELKATYEDAEAEQNKFKEKFEQFRKIRNDEENKVISEAEKKLMSDSEISGKLSTYKELLTERANFLKKFNPPKADLLFTIDERIFEAEQDLVIRSKRVLGGQGSGVILEHYASGIRFSTESNDPG